MQILMYHTQIKKEKDGWCRGCQVNKVWNLHTNRDCKDPLGYINVSLIFLLLIDEYKIINVHLLRVYCCSQNMTICYVKENSQFEFSDD